MACSKADQANQELRDINNRLVQQPVALSDFIKFMEDLSHSKNFIQTIESSKGELEEMERILKKENQRENSCQPLLKNTNSTPIASHVN